MRTFDLTPLYRSTVGFDRVFDLLDTAGKAETGGYPPYNIERLDENDYRITLAVAGFAEDELDVELHQNTLTVTGSRIDSEDGRTFLYQGIAGRSFQRRFQLAEHVEVAGASLVNGLLNIELRREIPEALKPRKISIAGGKATNVKVLKDADAA
ncbi:Hsp20 family protein [Hyphococcus sp.]|uniref:Hsp20 family protein n=1 Tax=Hyphococcus sp. TaxID=2038636 RepID=UPI002081B492|nr:MAG: small heat shock protein IbpA [Marinicaulis sp.]